MASRTDFPNDDDGEVLFRLASKGIDLTKKRKIEFSCMARNVVDGNRIAEDLNTYGYSSSVFVDHDGNRTGDVSIYAALMMKPEYELIILEQKRLNLILKNYEAKCDGWVTES